MNWDYLLFATLLITIHWWQESHRRKLFRRLVRVAGGEIPAGGWASRMPALAAVALAVLLALGWVLADYWEYRTRLRLQEASQGVGLFMAHELERLDHAAAPGDGQSPVLTGVMTRWLDLESRVDSIATLRKQPDGTNIYIFAVAAAGNSPGVRPGQAAAAGIPELEQAFQGQPSFQARPSADSASIRQFVPLYDRTGRVEAVFSLGFSAARWQRIILLERIGVMGVLFLVALALNTLYGAIFRRRIDAVCGRLLADQLQESETRFRNFADHAPVLLQVTDSTGDPSFFNQTWLEFTGKPTAAQAGRGWLDLVHPDDRPAVVAGRSAAFARRGTLRHEFRLKRACGNYRWMVAVYMPRWQGGNFAGYIISCTDITAHRRLEQTLRHQVEFEKMLAAVAAKFVNLSPDSLDDTIRETLAEVGRFTGADRACIYLNAAPGELRLAYRWNAPGVRDLGEEKPVIAAGVNKWFRSELATKGRLHVPSVAAMPATPEREKLIAAGIKSLVAVPLAAGGSSRGVFGLHSLQTEKDWREEEIALPRLVGEVIFGAIQRCQAETALAESEAENKAIIASVPDILYHVDADGRILDVKPAAQPGGPAVGDSFTRLVPAHLARQALDTLARALAGREAQILEYYVKAGSATAYCEARFARAGERGVLIIVRDITERRRSEACDLLLLDIAVKVLEEQPLEAILSFACQHVKAIFGAALLWVGRKEDDGAIRLFAAEGEVRDGVGREEITWHDTPAGQGPTGTAIRTGQFQQVAIDDLRIRPWRGLLRKESAVAGASFPLRMGGLILGALTVYTAHRDFWTKRTIVHLTSFAEQIALAIHSTASRQRLSLLTAALGAAANAVVITDRTGLIQWVNPAFLGLTGLAAAAGRDIRTIFGAVDDAAFCRDLWQDILAGKTWQGEITGCRQDGTVFPAEMTVTPVRDENGAIANFIAVVQDATQRRQAEQDMLEARETVARAERLSSLGIMAAGIAHEINQPLNSLKIAADGMLYWHSQGKTPTLAKIMENLEKISQQADRIDAIIKHMRFFVRNSEFGGPEPCDINAAVGEALSLTGAQLEAHAIDVRTCLAPGLPPVMANATQLEEVVINLIVNAMQALGAADRQDKCVTIASGRQQGEVFLEVVDNGPGISAENKSKIFEPFFTTKPAGEGMGLGLSIVHSIVASFGGRIVVKAARQSRGAAFRIAFPVADGAEKGEKRA